MADVQQQLIRLMQELETGSGERLLFRLHLATREFPTTRHVLARWPLCDQDPTLLIEQGVWMATPSPSAIEVRLELRGEAITGLFAGGRSRIGRRIAL